MKPWYCQISVRRGGWGGWFWKPIVLSKIFEDLNCFKRDFFFENPDCVLAENSWESSAPIGAKRNLGCGRCFPKGKSRFGTENHKNFRAAAGHNRDLTIRFRISFFFGAKPTGKQRIRRRRRPRNHRGRDAGWRNRSVFGRIFPFSKNRIRVEVLECCFYAISLVLGFSYDFPAETAGEFRKSKISFDDVSFIRLWTERSCQVALVRDQNATNIFGLHLFFK